MSKDPPFANAGWLIECSYPEPAALASNFLRIFFLDATLRKLHDFIVVESNVVEPFVRAATSQKHFCIFHILFTIYFRFSALNNSLEVKYLLCSVTSTSKYEACDVTFRRHEANQNFISDPQEDPFPVIVRHCANCLV